MNKDCQIIKKGPGRPSSKIEVNLSNPKEAIEIIISQCKNEKIKSDINFIGKALLEITSEVEYETSGTQTNHDLAQSLMEDASVETISHLISFAWLKLDPDTKIKMLMLFFSNLDSGLQKDFMGFLGMFFNQTVYESSLSHSISSANTTFDSLKKESKVEFYNKCDPRLRSFIDRKKEGINVSQFYK